MRFDMRYIHSRLRRLAFSDTSLKIVFDNKPQVSYNFVYKNGKEQWQD
jgi:DNA gyrase/topoisomerase IV subunit B